MSENEFTHPFAVDKLGPNPKRIHIDATEQERAALSERFDLDEMTIFKSQAVLQRLSGKKIECRYEGHCEIIQQCVVTFKPVKTGIDLAFTRVYDSSFKHQDDEKEVEIDIDATDELDPIIDGVIDLADALAEELGLEIDPYPRADGIAYTEIGVGPEITEEEIKSNNPFSVLAEIKNKSD
ncbi:conserved hypothetical protein [Candidatus Terasakiella magnetica]|uniref:DUF177 domain-containing protein n=1 Tax=Candidatus Terasakiella magnetica TaxID=1867952 RepID=A0A1C3RCY7_9PROT|nr:DUF177 domain-containing protein [Candidatus Terasakiella magnetica]SCA55131.1 conserved hypothetical protein [Candidatus Terasakiella magnetica]